MNLLYLLRKALFIKDINQLCELFDLSRAYMCINQLLNLLFVFLVYQSFYRCHGFVSPVVYVPGYPYGSTGKSRVFLIQKVKGTLLLFVPP